MGAFIVKIYSSSVLFSAIKQGCSKAFLTFATAPCEDLKADEGWLCEENPAKEDFHSVKL